MRMFEPHYYHYYQPGWTMLGANMTPKEVGRKPMTEVIPAHVPWTKQKVIKVDPELNSLWVEDGHKYTYETLIISTGFESRWDKIKGVKELLDDPTSNVCSIFDFHYALKTGKIAEKFKGGNAIFTEPPMPIKCAGAPQKILYLLTDIWKKQNLEVKVDFAKSAAVMFGIKKYNDTL